MSLMNHNRGGGRPPDPAAFSASSRQLFAGQSWPPERIPLSVAELAITESSDESGFEGKVDLLGEQPPN